MYVLLKHIFYYACKFLGIFRWYRYKQKESVIILTYHSVVPKIPRGLNAFEYRNCITPEQFEEQIKFLLRYYKPVNIDNVLNNDLTAFNKGFIITFDDGFKNNCTLAMPILKKYGLQGCFFVTTGLIGKNEMLWTEKITYLLFNTQKSKVKVKLAHWHTLDLHSSGAREKVSWLILDYLKASNKNKITSTIKQLQLQLDDVQEPDENLKGERYTFMDWDDVKKLVENGQIVGSHTHNHEIVSTLNPEQSKDEIEKSRCLLSERIDIACKYFSYPNGARGDFNETHKKQLKDAGYAGAFSQIPGLNLPNTDPYELRRMNIENMSMITFEATTSGFRYNLKGEI